LTPFVLALALMLGANWVSARELVLARNSNVFLLAKWIDEGPALSYLKEACPGARYALCAHLSELEGKSHDALKWGFDTPFQKLGGFDALEPEAREIVRGTLKAYPYDILRQIVLDVRLQFSRFRAGEGLSKDFAKMVAQHVGLVFGEAAGKPFLQSRQGTGELPIAAFRALHLIGLIVGLILCMMALAERNRSVCPKLVLLYAFVFSAILWSGVVTGALSGPYDRYLARIIWLVCFLGLLGGACMLKSGGSPQKRPSPAKGLPA
jgi:hypothetical protein